MSDLFWKVKLTVEYVQIIFVIINIDIVCMQWIIKSNNGVNIIIHIIKKYFLFLNDVMSIFYNLYK
jgi:hypothetical protein